MSGNQGRLLNVAIDGPAGAGKSTVAKAVADALGYVYVDTGAMYRAVTLRCLRRNADVSRPKDVEEAIRGFDVRLQNEDGRLVVYLDGEDVTQAIRRPEVGDSVSNVAKVPAVREALVRSQRAMASRGGVVMDGRDIGTVVLPSAEVKVFLTASCAERARRRHSELVAQGVSISYEEVLEGIRQRDEIDRTRKVSPLRKADDAVVIDSTGKSVKEVIGEILKLCHQRGGAVCST